MFRNFFTDVSFIHDVATSEENVELKVLETIQTIISDTISYYNYRSVHRKDLQVIIFPASSTNNPLR